MTQPARVSRTRPFGWAALAIVLLLVGYADLWRGGESVSALFLTIGYVLLVPIAIFATPHERLFKRP